MAHAPEGYNRIVSQNRPRRVRVAMLLMIVGGVQPLLSGAYTQRLDDPLGVVSLESQPATVVLHQANSEVV